MATSLTVPWTASEPMSPPGKNSGETTKESVDITIRPPTTSKAAWSSPRASIGLSKAGRKISSMSCCMARPPAPCVRSTRPAARSSRREAERDARDATFIASAPASGRNCNRRRTRPPRRPCRTRAAFPACRRSQTAGSRWVFWRRLLQLRPDAGADAMNVASRASRSASRRLDLAAGRVDLTHGAGGRAMQQLIEEIFRPAFDNPMLARGDDQAAFEVVGGRMVMSTDSFVVSPLFFPGGDIGSLAVHGTVNDVAMSGARPLYLSAGFIIEEGFPLADLERIARSMGEAARAAEVAVVTGDTKVVERGKADGLFINTC